MIWSTVLRFWLLLGVMDASLIASEQIFNFLLYYPKDTVIVLRIFDSQRKVSIYTNL
jgi:hypothetical protein